MKDMIVKERIVHECLLEEIYLTNKKYAFLKLIIMPIKNDAIQLKCPMKG